MRVLVTGGAGYVGGFAARHLVATGHDVTVLDDLCNGHRAALPAELLVEGDIGDRDTVAKLLRERRIEAVMHFAAHAMVRESIEDPRIYYRNNVAKSLALLEAMLEQGVRRIVFSSTCAVYAESPDAPLDEDGPLDPVSPYAFSKLAIERMIRDFAGAYGLEYALLRYFNAAGGSEDGAHGEDHRPETHLIPLALGAAAGRRPPLQVFGADHPTPDGTCIRDYVHVEDLARVHAAVLERPGSCLFNVGTGRGHSVLEVLRAVERVAGRAVPHRIGPRRAGDPARLVASCHRLEKQLGWTPHYADLNAIVASAWAWHQRNPDGYGS
ncbi:MAG: UDP-glucose 4-epimerase GalE [Myxococcota bacterium]